MPWLSNFHETNVRTYVHAAGRDPGVWFFSLDAANPVAVWLARTLWKLPYYMAKMRLAIDDDGVRRYSTEREEKPSVGARVSWKPEGEPQAAAPGTLAHFLCERYFLYSWNGKRLLRGQVHHSPYPDPAREADPPREHVGQRSGSLSRGRPLSSTTLPAWMSRSSD